MDWHGVGTGVAQSEGPGMGLAQVGTGLPWGSWVDTGLAGGWHGGGGLARGRGTQGLEGGGRGGAWAQSHCLEDRGAVPTTRDRQRPGQSVPLSPRGHAAGGHRVPWRLLPHPPTPRRLAPPGSPGPPCPSRTGGTQCHPDDPPQPPQGPLTILGTEGLQETGGHSQRGHATFLPPPPPPPAARATPRPAPQHPGHPLGHPVVPVPVTLACPSGASPGDLRLSPRCQSR